MTGPFAWGHVTTGPCTGCGARTTRYGPRGRPHCDDCLPAGEWLATHHLTHLPRETEPAMHQNPEPVRIADVIQAFRGQPGLFTAAAAPDPPEAA